jgi:hypothetical protein
MKKKNKKNTAIGPKCVDDENDFDKEDNKRKVPALVMWYLPVIDCLKHVFSNPRDSNWYAGILRCVGKLMRRFNTLQMELSGKNLIFNITHLDQKVEI